MPFIPSAYMYICLLLKKNGLKHFKDLWKSSPVFCKIKFGERIINFNLNPELMFIVLMFIIHDMQVFYCFVVPLFFGNHFCMIISVHWNNVMYKVTMYGVFNVLLFSVLNY